MPCLGPTGDPDLPDDIDFQGVPASWEYIDPQRILEIFTRVTEPDRCACPDPRFDVVTRAGVRHTQLCCACGKPGPDDCAC